MREISIDLRAYFVQCGLVLRSLSTKGVRSHDVGLYFGFSLRRLPFPKAYIGEHGH